MNGLGPFPLHVVGIAVAVIAGGWLARRLARGDLQARHPPAGTGAPPHRRAGSLFLDAVLVGLLAARAGFVLRWWPEYVASPASVIAIGDGGFLWWAGVPAAAAFAAWRTVKMRPLRGPVFAGLATGLLAWFAIGGMLVLLQRAAPPLPDIPLVTLDGTPVSLHAHAGRPLVLNLWATWCPPCRREMPVFVDAQRRYPGVAFVLLNQGEDAATVRGFLAAQRLDLDEVLLDPGSRAMQATGSRGLPTTLFFDARGRVVDTHMGELTRASLADTLRKRFGPGATATGSAARTGP